MSFCPNVFRRRPKVVDFFKSEIFGIFALFSIDRADVVTIMEAYEQIDTEYTRTINIPKFVKECCGNYGYLFRIIWYKYIKAYRGMTETLAEKYGVAGGSATTAAGGGGKIGDSKSGDDADGHHWDPHNPSYFIFTCFLLFIFSVENKDVNRLVYWIWFKIDNAKIGYPELCQAIEDVWGKSAKLKEQVHDYKETVIKSIKNLDTDPMTPHKFQLADWKLKTCWSAPVVNMLVAIKFNVCGVKFWAKLAPEYNKVCMRSVAEIRSELSEHITLQSERNGGYADNGERHASKTKLRQYFKFIHSYWTMGVGEKATLLDGKGYFDFEWWNNLTARYRRVRDWKIHPTGTWWFGGFNQYMFEKYIESDIDRNLRLKGGNLIKGDLNNNPGEFMTFKMKEDIPTEILRKKMHETENSSLDYMEATIKELELAKSRPIDFDLLENGLDPKKSKQNSKPKSSTASKTDVKKRSSKYDEIDDVDDEEDDDDDDNEYLESPGTKSRRNRKKDLAYDDQDDDISSIGDGTVGGGQG